MNFQLQVGIKNFIFQCVLGMVLLGNYFLQTYFQRLGHYQQMLNSFISHLHLQETT